MDTEMTAQQTEQTAQTAETEITAAESELNTEQTPMEDTREDGESSMTLSDDGELVIGDKFFETEQKEAEKPQEPEAPKFYTDDELRATPYANWDRERLTAEAQRVYDIASEQIAEAQAAAQRQQFEANAAEQAPKPLTRDEVKRLAEESAKKELKLDADDELDMYDPEHMAAYQMAINDVQARYQAERAEYADRVNFNRFSYELSRQPDFKQFDAYMTDEFAKMGSNPKDALLMFAQRYGRGAAQQYISTMYGRFKQTQAAVAAGKQPVKAPPIVESSGGNSSAVRKVDLNKFGGMNSDEQADALIALGIV